MPQNERNKAHTEIKLRTMYVINDILEKKLVKSKRAFCILYICKKEPRIRLVS